MMYLLAPHPAYKVRIVLPNPEWGNTERSVSTVQVKQALDGSLVTHVRKVPVGREIGLDVTITRLKSIELLEFYQLFGGELIKLTLLGTDYIGYLKINPLELEKTRRALVGRSVEQVNIQFDFETIL